jgi:flagellar biosynthesis/type III secretory pathway M-ring protein FliF/YscJ
MEFVLAAIVLVGVVALIVLSPLRKPDQRARVEDDRQAALEASKEQKYRDIRDAELDFRMGKLSESDWREADRELRAQAIEILRQIDALQGRAGARNGGADG